MGIKLANHSQTPRSPFHDINQELGVDFVSSLPSIVLPNINAHDKVVFFEPWEAVNQLPSDIVKGISPTGDPFLAVRYIDPMQENAKDSLILEICIQRNRYMGHHVAYSRHYYNTMNDGPFLEACRAKPSSVYQRIKRWANGEKIGSAYLPMYAHRFESLPPVLK